MAVFLTLAAAFVTSSAARYEGSRLLQEYFFDDDLWDSVYQNGIFVQKCIEHNQLCMCRSNGRHAHAFLCDHHEVQRVSAISSARANALNYDDYDQAAAYYFPRTGAQGEGVPLRNYQDKLPQYPPDPHLGANWTPQSPWKVNPQLGNPGRIAKNSGIAVARNHVISKATLKAFYKKCHAVIPDSSDSRLKTIFEPLFDAIYSILPKIGYAITHGVNKWTKWNFDPLRGTADLPILTDYIDGRNTGARKTAMETYFEILYIWAPGNLFYGPRDDQRVNRPAPADALDTEARLLMPAPQYNALVEAEKCMRDVIALPMSTATLTDVMASAARKCVVTFSGVAYNDDFIVKWDLSQWEKQGNLWKVR